MTRIQGTCNFMQVWVVLKWILSDMILASDMKHYNEVVVKSIDSGVQNE